MKITIVVDANIIISALLGGQPSVVLFDPRFRFVTSQITLEEVHKYLPELAAKLSLPEDKLLHLLQMLPLVVYQHDFYQPNIETAKSLIEHIDPKDVDILALALQLESYLWSQDKDLEKSGYVKVLKTYNFIE